MELNLTTNRSTEDALQCEPNPVANPVTTIYLATLHTVTLLAFLLVGKMVYDMIEISHPVFALAFQEIVVMVICKVVELICLLCQVVTQSDLAFLLYTFVPVAALQFHQVTWLSITALRYSNKTHSVINQNDQCKRDQCHP